MSQVELRSRPRQPRDQTLQHNLLQSGAMTLQQEAVCFLSSDEFRSAYGVLDDAAFVGQMFQNGLGRAADPAGAIYWTQQVAGGVEARAGLVLALNASPEHQAHATALMVQSP